MIEKMLQDALKGYPGVNYRELTEMANDMISDGASLEEAVRETVDFYIDEVAEDEY